MLTGFLAPLIKDRPLLTRLSTGCLHPVPYNRPLHTCICAGFLDPVLKNRRAITAVSAVVDVLLIIAGIKVFQNVTGGGE